MYIKYIKCINTVYKIGQKWFNIFYDIQCESLYSIFCWIYPQRTAGGGARGLEVIEWWCQALAVETVVKAGWKRWRTNRRINERHGGHHPASHHLRPKTDHLHVLPQGLLGNAVLYCRPWKRQSPAWRSYRFWIGSGTVSIAYTVNDLFTMTLGWTQAQINQKETFVV